MQAKRDARPEHRALKLMVQGSRSAWGLAVLPKDQAPAPPDLLHHFGARQLPLTATDCAILATLRRACYQSIGQQPPESTQGAHSAPLAGSAPGQCGSGIAATAPSGAGAASACAPAAACAAACAASAAARPMPAGAASAAPGASALPPSAQPPMPSMQRHACTWQFAPACATPQAGRAGAVHGPLSAQIRDGADSGRVALAELSAAPSAQQRMPGLVAKAVTPMRDATPHAAAAVPRNHPALQEQTLAHDLADYAADVLAQQAAEGAAADVSGGCAQPVAQAAGIDEAVTTGIAEDAADAAVTTGAPHAPPWASHAQSLAGAPKQLRAQVRPQAQLQPLARAAGEQQSQHGQPQQASSSISLTSIEGGDEDAGGIDSPPSVGTAADPSEPAATEAPAAATGADSGEQEALGAAQPLSPPPASAQAREQPVGSQHERNAAVQATLADVLQAVTAAEPIAEAVAKEPGRAASEPDAHAPGPHASQEAADGADNIHLQLRAERVPETQLTDSLESPEQLAPAPTTGAQQAGSGEPSAADEVDDKAMDGIAVRLPSEEAGPTQPQHLPASAAAPVATPSAQTDTCRSNDAVPAEAASVHPPDAGTDAKCVHASSTVGASVLHVASPQQDVHLAATAAFAAPDKLQRSAQLQAGRSTVAGGAWPALARQAQSQGAEQHKLAGSPSAAHRASSSQPVRLTPRASPNVPLRRSSGQMRPAPMLNSNLRARIAQLPARGAAASGLPDAALQQPQQTQADMIAAQSARASLPTQRASAAVPASQGAPTAGAQCTDKVAGEAEPQHDAAAAVAGNQEPHDRSAAGRLPELQPALGEQPCGSLLRRQSIEPAEGGPATAALVAELGSRSQLYEAAAAAVAAADAHAGGRPSDGSAAGTAETLRDVVLAHAMSDSVQASPAPTELDTELDFDPVAACAGVDDCTLPQGTNLQGEPDAASAELHTPALGSVRHADAGTLQAAAVTPDAAAQLGAAEASAQPALAGAQDASPIALPTQLQTQRQPTPQPAHEAACDSPPALLSPLPSTQPAPPDAGMQTALLADAATQTAAPTKLLEAPQPAVQAAAQPAASAGQADCVPAQQRELPGTGPASPTAAITQQSGGAESVSGQMAQTPAAAGAILAPHSP